MSRILIFGGTGFIGRSLAAHLAARGKQPILIARTQPDDLPYDFVPWDAVQIGAWSQLLEGAEAVVNLAGKTVDCIKTPDNCDLILRSRVDSTKAIGNALSQCTHPPKVWVQMSTAHVYGDPPSQVMTEGSTFGYGLAPTVGKAWEKAHYSTLPQGIRSVVLRTSFVIGRGGGALAALRRITKLGLGGTAGSGTQGMSWIHEYDMNEVIYQAIIDPTYEGPYIVSAPNPVSNRAFMKALRKQVGVPIGLPAPELMIRFGVHFLFRTDPELVLYGRYVLPARLQAQGYRFKFGELEAVLKDLID